MSSHKFITDENVGKLTKFLRLLGFDTVFFTGQNDTQMVNMALSEQRIILTRDTHIPKRKLITSGTVRAHLIKSDNIENQIQQIVDELNLNDHIKPFTLCLEDNQPLETRLKQEVLGRVPPYVYETRDEFMECPLCHRLYWKGTHWTAMNKRLGRINIHYKKEDK
jgi:uncharacterized protein with PIN domain